MVRVAINAFSSGHAFAISDLEHLCPTVSRATIHRVLNELLFLLDGDLTTS